MPGIEITVRVELLPDSEPVKAAPEKPKAHPAPPVAEPSKPFTQAVPFPSAHRLNLAEVSSLTGLSRGEIEAAVALGKLPKPSRRGRGIFFPTDAVRVFLMNLRAAERKSKSE